MSVDATTAQSGLPPFYRRRRFWRAAVPALSMIAAFLTGLVLFSVYHDSSGLAQQKALPVPKTPPTPKTVKLDAKELKNLHGLVKQFVITAVSRKHLAASYPLIGPALREGLTLKQWESGQIPLVPYPVDKKTWLAFEKPDWSYAKSVRFQVHVITPDKPLQIRNAGVYTFYVDLIKLHSRWLVNNWVPRWTPPIPNSSG